MLKLILQRIRCFPKKHQWRYVSEPEPYVSLYRCARCGKETREDLSHLIPHHENYGGNKG